MTRTLHATAIVLSMAMLTAGCGSAEQRLYPVRGRVVFGDGSPVQGGTIEFSSAEGSHSAIGQIGPDGTFHLTSQVDGEGTIEGRHKVIVLQGGISISGTPAHIHGRRAAPKYAN